MANISKSERDKLYTTIKIQLGASSGRVFQLSDSDMDALLDVSIQDYGSYVNNWLIEQQWHNLQGVEIDKTNLAFAFTTKTIDWEKSFTYAYSKQVGLGTNAPSGFELKRDYVTISADTQVYQIPAGREINEVLWLTPSVIDYGIVDPFAITNWGAGAFGWSYLGRPAQYMQPTYSLLLSAQDRFMKRKIMQSELTYRITAGPNGTKLLHLYPVPGSRYEIQGKWRKHFQGSKVWYFYYLAKNSKERDKCLELNNDIIRTPNDAQLDKLTWSQLNSISQNRVRKLLLAEVKLTLSKIRGYFSGELMAGDTSLTMDYRMLLDEGEREKQQVFDETIESLTKLSYKQLMQDRAEMAENLNKILGYVPFSAPFKAI